MRHKDLLEIIDELDDQVVEMSMEMVDLRYKLNMLAHQIQETEFQDAQPDVEPEEEEEQNEPQPPPPKPEIRQKQAKVALETPAAPPQGRSEERVKLLNELNEKLDSIKKGKIGSR